MNSAENLFRKQHLLDLSGFSSDQSFSNQQQNMAIFSLFVFGRNFFTLLPIFFFQNPLFSLIFSQKSHYFCQKLNEQHNYTQLPMAFKNCSKEQFSFLSRSLSPKDSKITEKTDSKDRHIEEDIDVSNSQSSKSSVDELHPNLLVQSSKLLRGTSFQVRICVLTHLYSYIYFLEAHLIIFISFYVRYAW